MIVEFICNRSGNKVRFSRSDDIASMRKQDGYTEVINESKTENHAKEVSTKENGESVVNNPDESKDGDEKGKQEANVLKKRGRPPKKK